jgi:phytoene desaturase
MQHAVIIGGGLGGLSTAALLAHQGYNVSLYEAMPRLGGRANLIQEQGFRFDAGPSWYLMPDVFEHYFALFGKKPTDYFELDRLDPSYKIFFEDTGKTITITGDLERDLPKFEELEPGVTPRVREYLRRSEYQYKIALGQFVYKNYDSVFDFLTLQTAIQGSKLRVFEKMQKYVSRYFKTDAMQKIMQYTLVFLGSSPYNTPALYNIMSHVDFNMGVFFPRGGIYKLVEGLVKLGGEYGVEYHTNVPVQRIVTQSGKATGIILQDGTEVPADLVISNADIAFTERSLLPPEARTKPDSYWDKRILAPSGLVLYLGVQGKIDTLEHHNLLFSGDWGANFSQIFDKPQLPDDPSFYVSMTSKTDATTAPEGHENIFVLVPIAAGQEYTEEQLDAYTDKILVMMEQHMGVENLRQRIVYQKRYATADYERDFHTLGGSALGLAHTISQTAIFRPNNVSKKLNNMYYVGAGTNPGIGMPMTLVSAELLLKRLNKDKSGAPLPTPLPRPDQSAAQ